MCGELHAMKERTFENWIELVSSDSEVQDMVYQVFGEPCDFYRRCKEGYFCEDLEDCAFDKLVDYDYEGMFYDPKEVLMRYAEGK